MAYSAIEKMRKKNEQIFGMDVGPMQPALSAGAATGFDLKSAALRFLHERCEGLLFDRQIEEDEEKTGRYRGASLAPGQIPYNMQMDINRLCLERELERFLDSAATQDAYTVFYCFLEIFFGNYGKYKKGAELLSEYETNGSSLLMRHRDHYSHSVFVFALGLAIYETNESFRRAFNRRPALRSAISTAGPPCGRAQRLTLSTAAHPFHPRILCYTGSQTGFKLHI